MKTKAPAARFKALFTSNARSTGKFDPKRQRMHTDYTECTEDDINKHLSGVMGIGLVPVLDDDNVRWAAIDIDNHGQDEDLPIHEVDEKIIEHKLPLVACRSKSGGIHCYAFWKEPQLARKARAQLAKWAVLLGYPKAEIFPKQDKLAPTKDGGRQLGNWINLPYLNAGETVRYAFRAGKKLTLEQFLSLAEKSLIEETEIAAAVANEHPQAPPCIQALMRKGVPQGFRNEAMYNAVVYFRKRDPETYMDAAVEFNKTIFDRPLARQELHRTINSASKPDYNYRCGEEPIRSVCDRETCIKRKYGISLSDIERLEQMSGLPAFSGVTKILSDPVRWELSVDDQRVRGLNTTQLLDWKFMREAIAERLTKVVPMIKNQEWERILQPLMADCRIIAAPDDASVPGIIRQRLREFAQKAHDLGKNQNVDDRRALLRGLPIVAIIEREKSVAFRAQDFVSYLKRTKSEELKGTALWLAVRDIGVQHMKMRVGNSNINVWYLPYEEVVEEVDHPEIKADL